MMELVLPGYPLGGVSWLLLCGALLIFALAFYAARQRHYPVAYWLSWLMLSMGIYTGAYAFELACATPREADAWISIEYIGASFIPAFAILMALSYRQHGRPSDGMVLTLLTPSFITLAVALSNSYHHLNLRVDDVLRVGSLSISQLTLGPWYYLHMAYLNVGAIVTFSIYVHCWRMAHPQHRRQVLLIIAGLLAPWVPYLFFLFGATPYQLDLSPAGFMVSALLYFFGIFHHRVTTLAPIARDLVFNQISEAVLVVDNSLRIVDFNRTADELFETLDTHSLGQPLLVELPQLEAALQQENQPGQLWLADRHYELKLQPLSNHSEHPLGYSLLLRDVTRRHQLIETLRQHAEYDSLTGLLNRRMILHHLDEAINLANRRKNPFSLLLFDLDYFKQINDNQGHQAGDTLLIKLSRLLQEHSRDQDRIGRYGGDEFIVLLPGCLSDEARLIAERINQLCQQHLDISLSMGLATLRPGEESSALLQRADVGLYQAKLAGRAQVATAS